MFKNKKNSTNKNLKNNKKWKIFLAGFLLILAGVAIGSGSYIIVLTKDTNNNRPISITI